MSTTSKKAETSARREAKSAARAEAKAELETLGKEIAERIKIAGKYEAEFKEKAGVAWTKYDQECASIERQLAEAQKKSKAAGVKFEDFRRQYAPDYKRGKLYEILAIADGRKTREGVRADNAERKRNQRVRDRADVTNTPTKVGLGNGETIKTADLGPAAQKQLAKLTGSAASEVSTADRRREMAVLAWEAPPPVEHDFTEPVAPIPEPVTFKSKEERIADALAVLGSTPWDQFKTVCEYTFDLMNIPTREQVRKYVSAETTKLDNKDRQKFAA
jgi:hypothetical protein